MKHLALLVGLLVACGIAHADEPTWQPSAGHTQVKIWPGAPPHAVKLPGPEKVLPGKSPTGETIPDAGITNVSDPTITVYSPTGKNTGTAVLVIPGGGFEMLAIGLEGTEVCDWLTAKGITCVLLKYRVPSLPYDWNCDCRPHNLALSIPSLEDSQRALRLVRSHAAEWHVDPHKIGVLGFSAGGFLVAEVSTQFAHPVYKAVDAVDKESARPDFAFALYPGHLEDEKHAFNTNVTPPADAPPTFILQAQDDYVDGVKQALAYFGALTKAGVPTELHIYAHGGHAFGLRPTKDPITHWPVLAETWLATIGML